jgi:hypothetical protein
MKNRLFWGLIAVMVLSLSTSSWASANSGVPGESSYTEVDKEFYLTEAEIAFIRPGLELEVIDTVIPADLQPEVTFKITDPAGMPLDREGVFTPGPVSTSFILSFIPAGEEAYVAYTTRVQTSPEEVSAIQASTDSGGAYTDMGDGVYMYKFATVVPADYDMSASHTMGMYARRDLTEWDLDRYVANELDHFVPSGGDIDSPRDLVKTATCNSCHDPLAIHGGSRQEVGLCILCHNPTQSIDPDTGNSVDMPNMVHKIHAGAHLENGYTIIGYRQGVHDYSEIEFTSDLNDCQVCHTGGVPTEGLPMVADPNTAPTCDESGYSMTELVWGDEGNIQVRVGAADGPLFASAGSAASSKTGKWVSDGQQFFLVDAASGDVLQETIVQNSVFGCVNNPPGVMNGEAGTEHEAWMTRPSRVACGACHDSIDFAAGEGHRAQQDDSKCATCHTPDSGGEFDISVAGAHVPLYKSIQLAGVLLQIINVEDTDPGDSPKVTFSLSDKYGPLQRSKLNRLRLAIAGPNKDFTFYVSEDVQEDMISAGTNWVYRFKASLPADAMGSFSIGAEGRASAVLNAGEEDEISMNDQMQNFIDPFAVTDDMAVERRMVVSDAKCESCHSNLDLHGSNRHDAGGYCQTCHRPDATDAAVRPADAGDPESIDFRYMIHKIHRGAELEDGFVVYGYRSSLHDFSDIHYVGDLRNCDSCHVDDSQHLPLASGLESVVTPHDAWTPMLPETASCLSCHDGESAAIHADSNTSDLGEACSTCHGEGKTYSVEAVHAR